MNILLLARIIARTGVGNHIKQLSEELVNQGHNVWVVASTNELGIGEISESVHFEFIELRSKNPLVILKSLKALHQIITTYNINIVHCHHRMAGLFMSWYNIRWKCPYVWTLHSAPIPHTLVHKAMTKYGGKAIAISKEVGDFLRDSLGVPDKNIAYVLNGVSETNLKPATIEEKKYFRRRFGIPEDRVVFAMHSRIDPVKNHRAVIEAVGKLSLEDRKRITILCSGNREGDFYDTLVQQIKDLDITENFCWCGWVEPREILGASDVLLFPSIREGFGLNCIEAMFMHIPVIRTMSCGGYHDMKDVCIGMKDATAETIAEHIRVFLTEGYYYEGLTVRAEEFAKDNCTCKMMTKNIVNVYEDVLEH